MQGQSPSATFQPDKTHKFTIKKIIPGNNFPVAGVIINETKIELWNKHRNFFPIEFRRAVKVLHTISGDTLVVSLLYKPLI